MRHIIVLWTFCLMACGSGGAAEPATAADESGGGENGGRPPALADCAGVWVGVGVQEGGPWTIELTLAPADGPGVCGTIEYPSLGCGGQVVDCVAEADGSITMREVYSHGLESCAPPGALRVSCGGRDTASEGHMSWVWSGEGGPVTSDLTRQ